MNINDDHTPRQTNAKVTQRNHPGGYQEEQLSRLLRFKKYELPPPGYYEDFLLEFQRRQRIESMRPNWWVRLTEGMENVLDRIRVPSYAYTSVGLFAIAMGAWILTSDEIGSSGDVPVSAAVAATPAPELRMDISSTPPAALPNPVNIPGQRFVGTLPPRYLLQSRPSGENEPFSF